jgi:hypothetical protein
VQEGKRPPRTVYEITEAGARELADWLAELLATPLKDYLAFEAGLSLMAALPPEEVAGLLHQRADALEVRLAVLRSQQSTGLVPRLFTIETEYLERLCEAELEFVRALAHDIESGALEGIDEWRTFQNDGDTQTGGSK